MCGWRIEVRRYPLANAAGQRKVCNPQSEIRNQNTSPVRDQRVREKKCVATEA